MSEDGQDDAQTLARENGRKGRGVPKRPLAEFGYADLAAVRLPAMTEGACRMAMHRAGLKLKRQDNQNNLRKAVRFLTGVKLAEWQERNGKDGKA